MNFSKCTKRWLSMGVGLGQNAHVILINLHICLAHTHSSFSIPSVAFFEGPGLIFWIHIWYRKTELSERSFCKAYNHSYLEIDRAGVSTYAISLVYWVLLWVSIYVCSYNGAICNTYAFFCLTWCRHECQLCFICLVEI